MGSAAPVDDVVVLHQRAKKLHLQGDAAQAITLYREVLERAPQLTEARFNLGVAHSDNGDNESALRECLAAIDESDKPPAGWLDSARRLADGVGCSDALIPDGGDLARQIRRGNALRIAGEFAQAEMAYRACFEPSGTEESIASHANSGEDNTSEIELGRDAQRPTSQVFAMHRLACLLAILGRVEEADVLFARAASAGIRFDASQHFSTSADAVAARGDETNWFSGALLQPGPEAAVLVSGDPLYLRRFLPALVTSLIANAGFRFALQVHAIDPDACLEDDLNFSLALYNLPGIAFSSERFEGEGATRSTTYACARYRIAHDLLLRAARPVLVLDLDLLVLGALPPPDASQFDAAWIRMHDTRWDPWDAENACVAWFLPTPGG
ncbi:MAG: tetratricopeptide repeat protein, partial [Burkholderiales bacterium]